MIKPVKRGSTRNDLYFSIDIQQQNFNEQFPVRIKPNVSRNDGNKKRQLPIGRMKLSLNHYGKEKLLTTATSRGIRCQSELGSYDD